MNAFDEARDRRTLLLCGLSYTLGAIGLLFALAATL
jgi:hypothetical protein